MIPNIIHMIYPVTEKTRPWSIVNTLAVKLACKHHKGSIYIWTNDESRIPGEVRAMVTLMLCKLPTHVGGAKIEYPQYVADVMRLQILLDHGGIYMDTDILLQKSLDAFLSADNLVMSWETPNCESVSNALMLSPPGSQFVAEWLRRMPEALQSTTWAYGGVVLPSLMANETDLEPHRFMATSNFACPLDLSRPWLFDPALKAEAKAKIEGSYAIHVFETFWRDIIKDITPEWLDRNDCLLRELLTDT